MYNSLVFKTNRASFLSRSLLCAAALLSPLSAFAGANTGGGGGGSIVCFDQPSVAALVKSQERRLTQSDIQHIVSIKTYDLFQAEQRQGFDNQAPSIFPYRAGEDYTNYLDHLARSFEQSAPLVSDLLDQALVVLLRAQVVNSYKGVRGLVQDDVTDVPVTDAGVKQVLDANWAIDGESPDCAVITTAYQYFEGTQLRIAVDRRLYDSDKNTDLSRAVLLLHEGLYAMDRARGAKDSRATRDLLVDILHMPTGYALTMLTEEVKAWGYVSRSGAASE